MASYCRGREQCSGLLRECYCRGETQYSTVVLGYCRGVGLGYYWGRTPFMFLGLRYYTGLGLGF